MFGKIAERYDLTNSVVSFQLHRLWNRRLAHTLLNATTLLDLCSGTGEIAYRWLKLQKAPKKAFQLDFCEEMLDAAKAKSLPFQLAGHDVRFMQADATQIPLSANSVDAVSIAYGIRNVQAPLQCFQEVYRVLEPQGTFAILELTEPHFKPLRFFHRLYLNHLLPLLGGLLTREPSAYAYLAKSVQEFTKPVQLQKQLQEVGFAHVSIRPLNCGIATLIVAKKP